MTNSEFKAWFEGFSEGIDKVPNAKQWAKIQEKVAQINDVPLFTNVELVRQRHWEYPKPFR